MRFQPALVLLVVSPALLAATRSPSVGGAGRVPQEAEVCRQGIAAQPRAILERARDVMGVRAAGERVLRFHAAQYSVALEQSDRWYPPYLALMANQDYWIDPRTGAERIAADGTWPGTGGARQESLIVQDTTWLVRDTLYFRSSQQARTVRSLDPWAVVLAWLRDPSIRHAGECRYRDYWRTVLARGPEGDPERLFLDPKSGYPVKLDFEEPHFLWGQRQVEYVYSTWITTADGGGSYPGAAFRLEDGFTKTSQTVSGGSLVLAERSGAPSLDPAEALRRRPAPPSTVSFLDEPPDTVRVSANTLLLRTRAYTETITLQGDTVYLLDATSGETRARGDSALIEAAFPGHHPVTVVVTDVAWPHIAGLRFWVARGARVITHTASGPFLQQVTAHRWTRSPDALEASTAPRGEAMRLTTVSDSLVLANGAVRLYPIDGAASEGALIAWIPADRYLWASDFVQTVSEPSQYASEVRDAVLRVGIVPTRFAAEHMELTEWAALMRSNPR